MKVWFTLTKGYVCQAMGIVHIDRICHYVTLHEMNDIFWTISQYSCVLNIDEWMDKAECTKYISYEFLFNKLNNAYKARRNLNVYVITKLYTPLHEMCCLSEPKKTVYKLGIPNVERKASAKSMRNCFQWKKLYLIDLFKNIFSEQMNTMWFQRKNYNTENRLPAIRLSFVSQGHGLRFCVCARGWKCG